MTSNPACFFRLRRRRTRKKEDPRAELVQQLLEYKMYKCMAYELRDRQMDAERVPFKEPTIPPEVAEYEEPVNMRSSSRM